MTEQSIVIDIDIDTELDVLTDVDNVLLDFNKALRRFMTNELGMKLPNDPMVDYYPAKVLGLSREWEVGVLTAFQDSEHFENLEPLPHAVSSIKKLREAGRSIIPITSCGHPGLDMDKLTERRHKNLARLFGEATFKEIHIVPAGESKLPYLQQHRAAYWAEDSVSNALDGRRAGHRSFVMDWHHNRHVPTDGLPRISDLRPFTRHVLRGTYPKKVQEGFVLRK